MLINNLQLQGDVDLNETVIAEVKKDFYTKVQIEDGFYRKVDVNEALFKKMDKTDFLYYTIDFDNMTVDPVMKFNYVIIPKTYIRDFMILSVSALISTRQGGDTWVDYTTAPYTFTNTALGLDSAVTPKVTLTTTYEYPVGEEHKLLVSMAVPFNSIVKVSVVLMKKPL